MKAISRLRSVRPVVPLVAASVLLGACTVMPVGPSVMAIPGSDKSIESYQSDVASCQQYAGAVIAATGGGTAAAADNNAAASAATGAALGAVTGAIIGGATGQAGQGAAVGAGFGMLFGGASGSAYTAMSSYQLQRGYDRAYLDCMYARGHRVPVPRSYARGPSRPVYSDVNPPPGSYPPPNTPPPPGLPGSGYPPPADAPRSSYPPPNTPPPELPPRK